MNARIFRDQLACAVYMRDKLVPLAALVAREFGAEADAPAMAEPIESSLDLATSPILAARPDGPPGPPQGR